LDGQQCDNYESNQVHSQFLTQINISYSRILELCQTKSSVQNLNLTCKNDYNLRNEEQRSFQPGWMIDRPIKNYNSSVLNTFLYKSSKELDSYVYIGDHGTYGGGGYVYEFRGSLLSLRNNLSQLHQLEWIDKQTRAVIIQCSLYNPNVQLFTSVTLLVELLSTGGIIPTARFEPFHIQGNFLTLLSFSK
jgi:hypothetical protein